MIIDIAIQILDFFDNQEDKVIFVRNSSLSLGLAVTYMIKVRRRFSLADNF